MRGLLSGASPNDPPDRTSARDVSGGGATAGAAGGAHPVLEVMNPLNALVGFASMLADVGHDLTPEQRHRYAVRVRDAADVLGRMVGSLVRSLETQGIDLGEEWGSSGTFRVSPIARPGTEDAAGHSSVPPVGPEASARPLVFVIDGDESSRELITDYLEGRGYDLALFASGDEALSEASRRPPDLIIIDPFREGDAGFKHARALKASNPSGLAPVLFVTALADNDSRVRALNAGAEQIVGKPVNRHELRASIKNLLHLRAQQEELSIQNAQLKSLQRFKDETTAMLVHDLKSPLTAMMMNLDFALTDMPGQVELADVRSALSESRAAGAKLFRMIANLLDIARSEDGRLVPRKEMVDLTALLVRVTGDHAAEALARKVTISRDVQVIDPIEADPDLLGRVIANLVENALRFTTAGGSVVITARHNAGALEILVENDGRPISPEWRPLVFEKYAQVSAASGMNRGLGLYFCRVAVEAHGGQIALVTTPPGNGSAVPASGPLRSTCFKITLPVA